MKKLLPIFLVLSVFVTGCNFANQTPEKSLSTKGDKALDDQLYTQAIQNGNTKLCEQIADKSVKEECSSLITANQLTKQAVADGDIGLCKKIDLERYKTSCETQAKTAADSKQADKDRLSIEQNAMTKGDAKLCDQIKDVNQKASCKYNILTNQAMSKKDPSLCNGIGLKDLVELCKQSIK